MQLSSNVWNLHFAGSAEDKLGGGTEKYKTKVMINSSGYNVWYSPAIFTSLCHIDTQYFPFDDQSCTLRFGSWAFDTFELDMEIIPEQTGVHENMYVQNSEWELLNVTAQRNEVSAACLLLCSLACLLP